MRSLLLLAFSASLQALPAFSLPTRLIGSSFAVPGNASFDYVVVGGGTAGLAIATRLAADPSLSVAVIEAGAFYEVDNGNISVIPGDVSFYAGTAPNNTQPLIDWGFDTVPQAVCPPTLRRFYAWVDESQLKGRKQSNHALCQWQDFGRLLRQELFGVQQASEELAPSAIDLSLICQDQPRSPSRSGRQRLETRPTPFPTSSPSTKAVSTTPGLTSHSTQTVQSYKIHPLSLAAPVHCRSPTTTLLILSIRGLRKLWKRVECLQSTDSIAGKCWAPLTPHSP